MAVFYSEKERGGSIWRLVVPLFITSTAEKAEAFHCYRVYKQSECRIHEEAKMFIFALLKTKVGLGKRIWKGR